MQLFTHLSDKNFAFVDEKSNFSPMNIAQDMGSTETRTVIFDGDANTSDVVHLDSNYTLVNRDISHVVTKNKPLDAQLELIMNKISSTEDADISFKDIHIVKGALMNTLSTFASRTTANSSKIDQIPTYINSIANIAINLLLASADKGSIPDGTVEIDLTIALPPEDTSSPVRLELFADRIAGIYKVEFPRLDCSISFEITKDRIHIFSESNAVAIALQTTSPIAEDDTVAFIDVGGRSTGYSFVRNGVLLEDGCVTEGIGGQKLKELVSRQVSNKLNTQSPSDEAVLRSMSTGHVKLGMQQMNVSQCITDSKEEVAEQIFNGFMLAIDRNGLQAQEISKVYCSGRSFGVSSHEGYVVSPSMMTMIEKMFKERCPYTQFELIDIEDPITIGLVYARFTIV